MNNFQALSHLGWSPFFQQQLSLEEWTETTPARVIEQHKSALQLATATQELTLTLTSSMPTMVVGDWLLLNEHDNFVRLLARKSCFKRKSAGTKLAWQLISANIDTAFLVCSLNEDFNLNRIERYLALVETAEVEPVVVLSKADLVDDADVYLEKVQALDHHLAVIAVNSLALASVEGLEPWLGQGKTTVLLGSSGVGKSSLTNTLLGNEQQATQAIRADDGKGKHTTTTRSLITLSSGALLLDTPGMRELQLADCQQGLGSVFADIEELAQGCKFADCQHQQEPGCAVKAAVDAGELNERRYHNYLKLLKENAFNSASLAEKRASDKSFGKFVKQALKESNKFKGRDG